MDDAERRLRLLRRVHGWMFSPGEVSPECVRDLFIDVAREALADLTDAEKEAVRRAAAVKDRRAAYAVVTPGPDERWG